MQTRRTSGSLESESTRRRVLRLTVLFLGLALSACGEGADEESEPCVAEDNAACVSQDKLWRLPKCDTDSYEYIGPAGMPCTTPDGLFTRTDCADEATQAPIDSSKPKCVTADMLWSLPNCDVQSYEYIGPPGMPCTTPDNLYIRTDCADVTTQTPLSGVNPVNPGTMPTAP